MKKLATTLILSVFLTVGCNNPNVAPTVKKVVPVVLQVAKVLCLAAATQHPWDFGGLTPQQWCNTADLVIPMFGDEAERAVAEAERVAESAK